jgi:hypothetical protein
LTRRRAPLPRRVTHECHSLLLKIYDIHTRSLSVSVSDGPADAKECVMGLVTSKIKGSDARGGWRSAASLRTGDESADFDPRAMTRARRKGFEVRKTRF